MSKRKITFTDTMIKALKPRDKKYMIGDGNGLNIVVYPSGAKAWVYKYEINGKRRDLHFGPYADGTLKTARAKFTAASEKVQNCIDPKEEQAQLEAQLEAESLRQPTVTRLIDEFIGSLVQAKMRTWKEDERILKKDVFPLWGTRKVADITRQDVLALIKRLRERGDAITVNTFKTVRRMFSYAVSQEYIEKTPCFKIRKNYELPVVSDRERHLSAAEIKTLWEGLAMTGMTDNAKRALKMILVTCQRPGEVVTMHRREIDGRWWMFTPKLTTVTRGTPRPQRMYLNDLALELIGNKQDYIFNSPRPKKDANGDTIPTPMTERSLACALRRNIKGYQGRKPVEGQKSKESKVVKEEKKLPLEHFTPHDLRRSGATLIAKLGYSDEVVDAVLAHLKKGSIRTYNRHDYDEPKKKAMLAWEAKLNDILAGKLTDEGDEVSRPKAWHEDMIFELTDRHMRVIELMVANGWDEEDATLFLFGVAPQEESDAPEQPSEDSE
jgi:integrase